MGIIDPSLSYVFHRSTPLAAPLHKEHSGYCCHCNLLTTLYRPCSGETHPPDMATAEHIVPRSQGGTDSKCNLELACRRCNFVRGNSYPVARFRHLIEKLKLLNPECFAHWHDTAYRDRYFMRAIEKLARHH